MFTTTFRRERNKWGIWFKRQLTIGGNSSKQKYRLKNILQSRNTGKTRVGWKTNKMYTVTGMFTINFKREFVRCCCCIKNTWNQRSARRMTQSSRLPVVHYTSYVNGKVTGGSLHTIGNDSKGRASGADSGTINMAQRSSSQSSVSNERANVNNFMKLSIPILNDGEAPK